MSANKEVLQEIWTPSDNLVHHYDRDKIAHEVIGSTIVKPKDDRFDIAYDVMVSGKGQQSTVFVEGPYGTAKTRFGNLVFGSYRRVDMDKNDTHETLYGYRNPTDSSDYIPGKLMAAGSLDPEFQGVYGNELPDNPNSRIVNPMHDGPTIEAAGKTITVGDLVAYYTGNFAGRNVHKLDESTLSRMTMKLVTGDMPEDLARLVQGYVESTNGDGPAFSGPLLPKVPVRKAIHELVQANYPDPEDQNGQGTVTGNFTVDLGMKLNESGLFTPVSISDARIGQAFRTAARGYMFGRGVGISDGRANVVPIAPLHVAKVAALVMPTVVQLSNHARHNIQEKIDGRVGDLEQAAIVRTLIAKAAFELASEKDDQIRKQEDDSGKFRTRESVAEGIERGVRDHAYVNLDVIRPEVKSAIDELVNPSEKKDSADRGQVEGANNGKRRIAIPGIARFRNR